jgi:hypothetical protein
MMGACFSSATTGSVADVIGSATSTGISAAVNRTGVLVSLAIAKALAVG